jgi:localization factor PodJL
MRYVPWHVKVVRPELREVARNAARRSGLSVGAWLNSLIIAAAAGGYRPPPASIDPAPPPQPTRVDDAAFAAIRKDIDGLKRQMSQPQVEFVILEQRLREIEARIDALQSSTRCDGVAEDLRRHFAEFRDALRQTQPVEEIAKVWRHDLGEISATLRDAMSASVIAALEGQVRALGERLEEDRGADAATGANTDVEQALADIRDRLGALAPAEELTELSNAVRLNFDAIVETLADRGTLKNLEQRIDMLVDKLANFETQSDRRDGADRGVDELLRELRELRAQNESRLAAVQQQVATSAAEAISAPAESIRRDVASLKEIQASVDRRTQDTFEAVYGTIEQVVHRLTTIEDEFRDRHFATHDGRSADKPEWDSEPAPPPYPPPRAGERKSKYPPPHAGEGREGAATAMVAEAPSLVPSAAPVASRIATLPTIEPQGAVDWGAMAPSDALPVHPSATGRLRHSAVPGFAPDASLEPAAGARRARAVANAIDRIAASEAVNAIARPAETSAPLRAKFVAAARRAAWAVASEHKGTPTHGFEKTGQDAGRNIPLRALFGRLRRRAKSGVFGVSMVLLILSALPLTLDFSHNFEPQESVRPITRMEDVAQPGGELANSGQLPFDPPSARQDANPASPTLPVRFSAGPLPVEATIGHAMGWGIPRDGLAPAAISAPAATQTAAIPPEMDAFSSMRNALLQGPALRDPASSPASSAAPDVTEMPLPPTIGGKALLAAASEGDPGASYEIALRFAQGRNVAQDLPRAALWLERAARSGLAPAQFRLGSMYEKGLGVKKDLAEARRLYFAAADKGYAKAMHNLAVLYAGGLDGKPDYAVASQWFRRAAERGIVDSQYNLAILYARGVGVERNLAESYKWFFLAAKGGDKDAARKRDEVAMRLDPKQLESAKLNAESFGVVPQPDEATAAKAPAGGWDEVTIAATTKPKALVRPERFSVKQDPTR